MGPEIAGAIAGQGLGALLGGIGAGKSSTAMLQDSINSILNKALKQAIGTSTDYTNKAIGQQNQSLSAAIDALTGYGEKAISSATGAVQGGFQTGQALRSPYSRAGYNALDAYQKTLGLATPAVGSATLAGNLQLVQQLQPLLQGLKGNYQLGAAPELQSYLSQVQNSQIQDYIRANIKQNVATNHKGQQFTHWAFNNNEYGVTGTGKNNNFDVNTILNDPNAQQYARQQLAQQQFGQAQGAYQQRQGQFNQLNQLLQGANIQQLAPLLRGKL